MLKRILDTTQIDTKDKEIKHELDIDLKRMDRLYHEDLPKGVNAYKVTVTPSVVTYNPGLHRFRFEIQYGKMYKDKFEPKGKSVWYQSESLPMD